MKDVITDSAGKMKDILESPSVQEEDILFEDDAPTEDAPTEGVPTEEENVVSETAEAVESLFDDTGEA